MSKPIQNFSVHDRVRVIGSKKFGRVIRIGHRNLMVRFEGEGALRWVMKWCLEVICRD